MMMLINLIQLTHNAPLEECLDIFELGCPVFMSGEVYNLKNKK